MVKIFQIRDYFNKSEIPTFSDLIEKLSIIDLFPIVLWTLTHFQPTQQGYNPKIKFLDYNLTVTTLKILTRLKILGCNPNRVKLFGLKLG
jgi:hypothetical protein